MDPERFGVGGDLLWTWHDHQTNTRGSSSPAALESLPGRRTNTPTDVTGNFPLLFPDFLYWGIPTGNPSNQRIRGLVGSLGNVKKKKCMIISSAFAQNIIIIFGQRYPNNSHACTSLEYLSSVALTLFELLPGAWCCDSYSQHIDAIYRPRTAQAMPLSLYRVQKVSSFLESLGRRSGPLHFLKSISIAIWELT